MFCYFLRHGESKDEKSDFERPLTQKGEKDIRKLGRFLRAGNQVVIEAIYHSPFKRAEQTAKVFAQEIGYNGDLEPIDWLTPEDPTEPMYKHIQQINQPALFVGHNPQLTHLISHLVSGSPVHPVVRIKKSMIVCLERPQDYWALEGDEEADHRWVLRWAVSPELYR